MSDQVNIDFHENQDDATLLKLIRADKTLVRSEERRVGKEC